MDGTPVTGFVDAKRTAEEVELSLEEVERHLLELIESGAQARSPLEDVVNGIVKVVGEIRPVYGQLHDLLGRRDLPYEVVSQLQRLRRKCAWLYRKSRLEHLFFSKLRLERNLRDGLYKQVVETYQEMSTLEEEERAVRDLNEEALLEDLVGEELSRRNDI